jgi:hypothetical protein
VHVRNATSAEDALKFGEDVVVRATAVHTNSPILDGYSGPCSRSGMDRPRMSTLDLARLISTSHLGAASLAGLPARLPPKKPLSLLARSTPEEIERVIRECRGNVRAAARHFKVTRSRLAERINKSEHLKRVVAEERDAVLDAAEQNVNAAVSKGDLKASYFVLRTIGKHRGYSMAVQPVQSSAGKSGPKQVLFIAAQT